MVAQVVQLQRVLSREVGDTKYWKYQVVLPKDAIEDLGWEGRDELEAEVENGAIVLRRVEDT